MNIIGINEASCATACLLQDGKVAACISEERLSRIKNQACFPIKAVQECLRLTKLTPDDIDQVILSSTQSPPAIHTGQGYYAWATSTRRYHWFNCLAWMRHQIKCWKMFDYILVRLVGPLFGYYTRKQRVELVTRLTGIKPERISFVDHHLAHAYAAIYGSGWADDDLLVITIDGEGDMISSTVGTWKKKTYQRIAQSRFTDSLGGYYAAVTLYLGMKPHEHEYKVMGMAPYASGKEVDDIVKKFKDCLRIDTKTLSIWSRYQIHVLDRYYAKFLRYRRFDHIAAATQKHLENLLVQLIKAAVARTGLHTLVVGGGVFMNVKANQLLAGLLEVERFFVVPSCGDESLALGSCYYGHHSAKGGNAEAITHLYWGNAPDETGFPDKARQMGFAVEKPSDMTARVVDLLVAGEIVARCAGRMEFGARALGNRSILADPTSPAVVERINRAIKHRDFWMPFAPVILEEHVADFVARPESMQKVNPAFMMHAFDTTPSGAQALQGAIHPYDKTARAQVLRREQNPGYYDIIKAFGERTGRYGLLNTSFNIHGYPIVCTTEDALQVLKDSGLKYLVLGSYLVHKPKD
jgi:carbamoyltransferase